jgi:voltage-gated potassium channel
MWRLVRRPPTPLKALLLLSAVIYYTAAGFMYFEMPARPELRWSDALWWTIVTMSTVGFGDYFPISVGGRLFVGVPAMMVGVSVFGYAFSQAAVFLMRAESFSRRGFRVQKLPDSILVCNYPSRPRFLRVLAEIRGQPELEDLPVVLIDEALDTLDADLAHDNVHFVRGHPGRENTLRKAAVDTASRAVVLARDPTRAESDNFTLAICLTIKQLRPSLRLVAECVDPENEEILRRAGCESIVCVMNLGPSILAHELYDPGVI